MINIHKLILTLIIIAAVIFLPNLVMAKSDNANPNSRGALATLTPGNQNKPKPTVKPKVRNLEYLQNTVESVDEAQEEINNEDVDEELETIQEDVEDADLKIRTSFERMEARPGMLKFILGADYKNAGQVRSEIVHLRNQIRQLTHLQTKTKAAGDQTAIQATITSLNQEMVAIQTRLSQELEGFSLFGWLVKFLTGFTPAPSPSPSGSPAASLSPSPSATAEASVSPSPTLEPTLVPTASASALPTATP